MQSFDVYTGGARLKTFSLPRKHLDLEDVSRGKPHDVLSLPPKLHET